METHFWLFICGYNINEFTPGRTQTKVNPVAPAKGCLQMLRTRYTRRGTPVPVWRTIAVTFTPGAVPSFSATISVADAAAGSPQTVTLSGAGTAAPDFAENATPCEETVSSGELPTYQVTVGPVSGDFRSAAAAERSERSPERSSRNHGARVSIRSAIARRAEA